MSSINNSVETVNAAATAIVSAESRVQPTSVQKRRWSSFWSLYWCFGSNKQSKRIGHALFVPESTVPAAAAPLTENRSHSTTVIFPFIAPPSSPVFLQSDPPSASYTPVGLLSSKSLSQNPNSQGVSSIFNIGPYAYETQLVSPPVFSTYTTEPSTASFTPPPEPLQMTTPSSPEVPFAQLLTSSLACAKRNSARSNQKFSLSQYEFQPYQARKWGPRIDSGSALDSGSITPYGMGSRLGSGSMTPNGWGSRLGSGTLTPNGGEMSLMETQISEVASLANSETSSQKEETLTDHRVSFELTHVDGANRLEKNLESSFRTLSTLEPDSTAAKGSTSLCEYCIRKNSSETLETPLCKESEETQCNCKRQSVSRDFKFDNTKGEEAEEKSTVGDEWWTAEKAIGSKMRSQSNWTFFPMLQPSVS